MFDIGVGPLELIVLMIVVLMSATVVGGVVFLVLMAVKSAQRQTRCPACRAKIEFVPQVQERICPYCRTPLKVQEVQRKAYRTAS